VGPGVRWGRGNGVGGMVRERGVDEKEDRDGDDRRSGEKKKERKKGRNERGQKTREAPRTRNDDGNTCCWG